MAYSGARCAAGLGGGDPEEWPSDPARPTGSPQRATQQQYHVRRSSVPASAATAVLTLPSPNQGNW